MSREKTNILPSNWSIATIEDIAQIVTGNTPPTTQPDLYGGPIPFIKPPALQDRIINEVPDTLTDKGGQFSRLLPADAVLVSCIGNLGRTGLTCTTAAFNQQINAAIFAKGIYPRYGFYACQTLRPFLEAQASSTTIPIVNKSKFSKALLPIAPLAEQHRIVAEIEKQFSRLDAGVAALKRVQANLKRYRAAVLRAACEGRLVPTEAELARQQGRDYEPADVLLQRILCERRARWEAEQLAKLEAQGRLPLNDTWKAKYHAPDTPDISDISELPELSNGWCWANVEQVSQFTKYGSSAKTSEEDTGVPVLRMGNIQEGRLDLSKLKYLPSQHAEFPDLLLTAGDLLFNRTNSAELVGKSAVYKGWPHPCSYASYLIAVRLMPGCLADYLCFCLNSSSGKAWVKSVVTQQVGQANVNGTKLLAFRLALPPLAEQERIVAEVERRLSVVDELEATVIANLKRAERLRQAILQRAFSGNLVPQDPNDEPANVLLKRIQTDMSASVKPKQEKTNPQPRSPRQLSWNVIE